MLLCFSDTRSLSDAWPCGDPSKVNQRCDPRRNGTIESPVLLTPRLIIQGVIVRNMISIFDPSRLRGVLVSERSNATKI